MDNSEHFEDMLRERGIKAEWVKSALESPDSTVDQPDGTRHFMKRIPDFQNRWLRVIVNMQKTPPLRITAFFDRRLRKKNESQSR